MEDTVINVDQMKESQGKKLIENIAKLTFAENNFSALGILLERLGNIPLAISQAVTYIQRTSMSIQTYTETLKKQLGRLVDWMRPTTHFTRYHRYMAPIDGSYSSQQSMCLQDHAGDIILLQPRYTDQIN
jgi:hypothetical protein